VHVFFVISGFCIAEKLASLAARDQGVGAFIYDHFWRIFPPYWAILVVAVLLNLVASPVNQVPLAHGLTPTIGLRVLT